jgi:hypothetical protein
MRISQPAVSKLERRADVSVSALRDYVAALGGELELSARFPDGVVRLAVGGPALRYAERAPVRKVAERRAAWGSGLPFEMPEDWAAEVIRIRAMEPEDRMQEVTNFTKFFAEAKRA